MDRDVCDAFGLQVAVAAQAGLVSDVRHANKSMSREVCRPLAMVCYALSTQFIRSMEIQAVFGEGGGIQRGGAVLRERDRGWG